MRTSYQFLLSKCFIVFLLFIGTQVVFADDTVTTPSASSNHPTQNKKTDDSDSDTSSTLIVHKPATDPSWGKVIQYQEEKTVSTVDKTAETLHKFLFQDSDGIVRVAIYHESESGTGYWEVWVWDQP
jgi:hypothetical protein